MEFMLQQGIETKIHKLMVKCIRRQTLWIKKVKQEWGLVLETGKIDIES